MQTRISVACVAALSLGACVVEEDPSFEETELEVMGGADEPDYHYPWVVRVSSAESCGGVLIDPRWVLTAAHCMSDQTTPTVSYSRTDAYTGQVVTVQRTGASGGVHIHPQYPYLGYDLALVKLSSPFVLDRYIQTVALPTSGPPGVGTIGTVASSIRHDAPAVPGKLAVVRSPVVDFTECGAAATQFCVQDDDDALCRADSGSGFFRNVGASFQSNGRATVFGTASGVPDAFCEADDLGQPTTMEDLYAKRAWIAETTGISLGSFAGDARVRWDGQPSRGLMTVRCEKSPLGTTVKTGSGPMNARGAEVRLDCPTQSRARATCDLGGDPAAKIIGFKMVTINPANGASTTTPLPYSPSYASYVSSYDSAGVLIREFTCKVGPVAVP